MVQQSVRKRMEDLALAVVMIDRAVESGHRCEALDVRKEIVDSELRKLEVESARYWFASMLRERLKELEHEWQGQRKPR